MEKKPERRRTCLAETEDGFLTRVPEEKLEARKKAQAGPAAPLNRAERQLRDKIVQRVFGGRK